MTAGIEYTSKCGRETKALEPVKRIFTAGFKKRAKYIRGNYSTKDVKICIKNQRIN